MHQTLVVIDKCTRYSAIAIALLQTWAKFGAEMAETGGVRLDSAGFCTSGVALAVRKTKRMEPGTTRHVVQRSPCSRLVDTCKQATGVRVARRGNFRAGMRDRALIIGDNESSARRQPPRQRDLMTRAGVAVGSLAMLPPAASPLASASAFLFRADWPSHTRTSKVVRSGA